MAIEGNLIIEVGIQMALNTSIPRPLLLMSWEADHAGHDQCPHAFVQHLCQGNVSKGSSPRNFIQILKDSRRLDKALNLIDVYYSALIPLIDCVKNGTTTILDHHASPFAVKGSLQSIARAAQDTGVRSCLCYEVSDRDGEKIAREGIEENTSFIAETRRLDDDLLAATWLTL